MQELTLPQVFEGIEDAFRREDLKRVEALLWPALEQYPQVSQFWFYGGCILFKQARCAIAEVMFRRAIDLEDHAHIYSNLGACYRRMNLHESGISALRLCLDRDPDYQPALVNLGSMYVNEGIPNEGIPYLEKAVELGKASGKTESGATWNLGLLYLEAGRFGEGFDYYRMGVTRERMVRSYSTDEKREPRMFKPGDVRKGKTLLVWGEQGIGDELMFATILEDAVQDFEHIIFECHPRLEEIHRRCHPDVTLFATRKDVVPAWYDEQQWCIDYKMGIADLGAMYRRRPDSFAASGSPPYVSAPNEKEVARYREGLEALANGRPIVGLATRGGVMSTARTYRTMRIADAERLFESTDCLFVALDYDDMTGFAQHIEQKFGAERYRWFPSISQHWDYHHVAALVAATDLTVTVCQSVAHLSAGMGHATRVLTPKRCAWRYAPVPGWAPERWYWYDWPGVALYRQGDDDSWDGPIDRVIADIKGLRP